VPDICVPFKKVPAEEEKLAPLTVSVNAALPAGIEAGLRLVMTGSGSVTEKVTGADVPHVLVTVTLTVPTVVIRLEGTSAVSVFPPAEVVASGAAPQLTTVLESKYEPKTHILKVPEPAAMLFGDTELMTGCAGLMVKGSPDEVPPLVTTVTVAEPKGIRLAGTTAVIWVELMKVVASAL
jgi:hypothetical protein